ncbi:MAG: class I SAM-dependent methyltransferase [Acidobacteria bacterium]|jgi:2-polyprenyl-3-methyl-5-hydroxy-6-metoxy-1,4-benzoquinol methylase|nr:class I SAM-dependent methyltransferase [Acidobacteriota bacterium]
MYKVLSGYYNEIFPLKEPRISFVRSFLKLVPCRILDAGCAAGQLAVVLAGEGHKVTGIDLDAGLIQAAKQEAGSHGLEINFAVMNMMDIDAHFPSHSFDAVLCLGNTLVHLQSPAEIAEFMQKVYRVLKKEGVFIIQIVNYDHVLAKGITELPVIDTEHVRFERHYIYDKDKHKMHFQTRFTVKKDMTYFEDEVSLYPLVQSELDSLIKKTFNEVSYYGDFAAKAYTIDSPALIAAARKRN